jgi:hypothetical protein
LWWLKPPSFDEAANTAMYDLNKKLADELRGRVAVVVGPRLIGTSYGLFLVDSPEGIAAPSQLRGLSSKVRKPHSPAPLFPLDVPPEK